MISPILSSHNPVNSASHQLSHISAEPRIVLKELPDSIRETIIEANFTSKNSSVLFPVDCKSTLVPKSHTWKIFKEALYQTYQEKGSLNIAFSVMKITVIAGLCIAAAVGFAYLLKQEINNSHAKIGKYFNITTYQNGIALYTRYNVLYTTMDHYLHCFRIFLSGALVSLWGALTLAGGSKAIADSDFIFKNFNKFKADSQKDSYEHTVKLKEIDSSLKNVDLLQLANGKDYITGELLDPISLEIIPKDEVRSAKILAIGQYAIPVQAAIQSILSKEVREIGKIPHPIERRFLLDEEKEKFLKDVSTFFCTSEDKLQACWEEINDAELDQEAENFAINNYKSWQWSMMTSAQKIKFKAKIKNSFLNMNQNQKTMDLLPDNIRLKYFPDVNTSLIYYYPL